MRTVFDLAKKRKKIKELEKEAERPDFWQNQEKAARINQDIANFSEEVRIIEELKKEIEDLRILTELNKADKNVEKEIEEKYKFLYKKVEKLELETFLSAKYDKNNAILSVFSGAGGQDAQDWAAMLLRMYERYAALKGFKTKILHQSFGEGGGPEGRIGIKSATLEIKGKFAFGFLQKETGVHRLVRISPFSAKGLRHTSFALIEILPEISNKEESEIKISPEDLRIDLFRASGPGGQHVNRRETAVRIIHLPTNISVSCQSERSQAMNREKAMSVLVAKLHQLKKEDYKAELKKIKKVQEKSFHRLGEGGVSAGWGNQIRSYILHPYKLVKDLRTGIESSDVEGVLDGNLEQFIISEIKLKNDKI